MKRSGVPYNGGQINFSIIECTRGRKHGQYFYVGERTLLENPVEVPIKIKNTDGTVTHKSVTYQHKNKVNKVKKSDLGFDSQDASSSQSEQPKKRAPRPKKSKIIKVDS